MVKLPSAKALAKYGLDEPAWRFLNFSQCGACAVCKQVPGSGRLYIDHEHVKGWTKMPPNERRKYVRGLLCYMDNRFFLAKGATVARLSSAAEYLRDYERRKSV